MMDDVASILKYKIKNMHRKKTKEAHYNFERSKSGLLILANVNTVGQMPVCLGLSCAL